VPQELQARREQLHQAQRRLTQQIERLTEAYLGAVIPLAEYQRRRQDLEQKHQALATQDAQLSAQVDRRKELAGVMVSVEDFCRRVQAGLDAATFEQKRQLIELLIDRVIVANGDVEIRYVIPTSPSSEHVRFCHLRSDYFNAPDMIGGLGGDVAQQIEVDSMLAGPFAEIRAGMDSGNAHLAHRALDPLAIDRCEVRL
jgi:site-specific DNA recombinase